MSNMYFVTSDSLSDFMEVRYIIWAGNIEDLVLPGTWTIPAGQKKLKSECPHMPESIKTLWEDSDDSNYVILPDMTGRFCMMETNPQNVGILHDAQAPNIIGKFANVITSNPSNTAHPFATTGAFWSPTFTDGALHQMSGANDLGDYDGIGFDANRSNSTYQNGGTIRPKSISVLILIRI